MLTDRGWSNKKFSLSSSPKSNIITKEYFAMIHTILDTDLYKFTTSYAYIKLFPYAMGTFSFKDRDDTAYTDTFLKELQKAVDSLAQTVLTAEELEYMTRHCRFLPRIYWEWLSSFRFQPEKVSIHLDEDRHLNIEITDYLYKATLYEVPLLSIVSEIKNRSLGNVADMDGILCKLSERWHSPTDTSYIFGVRHPETLLVRGTGQSHRPSEGNRRILYRDFQLPLRHEIRHEAYGDASA